MSRILVILDDSVLRTAVQDILELEGYETLSAESGPQGLEMLAGASTAPALIMSGNLMKHMSGPELLQKLRSPEYARFAQIPFVLMTGMDMETIGKSLEHYGLSLPPEYILQFPFDAEELYTLVKKLTGG